MHRTRVALLALILGLVVLPTTPPAAAQSQAAASSPAALWEAARTGDVSRVRALLDAGVDPDAPSRYGATALSFAAQKGHLEVVRLLLERGATVDVTDTFYDQTPLAWALSDGHFDVAVLLLEKGAADVEQALVAGVRAQNRAVLEAVLARGPLHPWQKSAALEMAEQAEGGADAAIVELLRGAPVHEELPEVTLTAAQLAAFAGRYEREGEEPVVIRLEEGVVQARLPGEEEDRAFLPVAERELRAKDDLDLGLVFYGRSGTTEGLAVLRRAQQTFYRPAEPVTAEAAPAATSERAAAAPAEPAPGEAAPASPHWPSFRGTGAAGVGSGDPPVAWNLETGEHVLWQAEIPGLGNSSPVVWGDRVFVTTAVAASGDREIKTGLTGDVSTTAADSEHTWQVLALDKRTGEVLWRREAGKAVPETGRHFKSTQANSTPATDGERVAAVFPTVGLVVYDLDGELLWKKDLGALDAGWFYDESFEWGYGSSPILHDGKVILQVDTQDDSFIAAWDAATGKELWRTERGELPTWSTPMIAQGPKGPELVTNGPTARGYDPATGKELWRLGPSSELVIATPVAADGVVYLSAGYPPVRPIYALRLGGRGDLSLPEGETESEHVVWSHGHGGAYMPSPILVDGLYYLGHHNARLFVYDAATGEIVYRARFSKGGTFTGSPVYAAGKLYFTTEEGQVYVVRAGREHEELAVNDMGEVVMTTPAISEGTLFIRTRTHLVAIGEEEGAAAAR